MILDIQALYFTDVSCSSFCAGVLDVNFDSQKSHGEDGRNLYLTPSGHL